MKAWKVIFPVIAFSFSLGISIKIYDYFLWNKATTGPNSTYYKLIAENKNAPLPMQEMVYYPYTGAHIKGHVHYFGPIPLESTEFYKNMEYKSGKHGFFTELDVDNPPPKKPDEFRIILIGGSSAQGWGAQYVKDMVYQVLEHQLNKDLASSHIKVTVLNLAMAGSISYQNYYALNVWGHNFDPDLILSYSGGNDLLVPVQLGSDAPMAWSAVQSYIESMHITVASSNFRSWAQWFPGIVYTTIIGRMIRFFGMSISANRVLEEYAAERDMTNLNKALEIATPLYIKAFKSIKRDFDGIPIMIAFQPIDYRTLPDTSHLGKEYSEMIHRTIQECQHYKNSDWYFVNLKEYWNKNNLWAKGKLGNGLHLPSIFQQIVAQQLAINLEPIIRDLMKKRLANKQRIVTT